MFSKQLSDLHVVEFCRSMRYSLASGFMLLDALELVATRGDRALQPVARKLVDELKVGWNMRESLDRQAVYFPPLFIALVDVGEETGNLPEILGELEKYYNLQIKLHRDFVAEIFWPVIQFVFAVLIVALVIWLVGVLPQSQGINAPPLDPTGLGLIGERGALLFLAYVFGTLLITYIAYRIMRVLLARRPIVERLYYYIPLFGPCLIALAMTRFCTAFRLMLETDLSIRKTLDLALSASDNQLFIEGIPAVQSSLERGNSILESLTLARCLPDKFLSVVAVAEECGRLSEAMRQQAEHYDEFARRRLVLINQFLSWSIWASIAIFITYMVYSIFTNVYVENLNRYYAD